MPYTAAVTQYLVEEIVPLNTVEKPAFKSMLQKFDKQYELPVKTYFSAVHLAVTNCSRNRPVSHLGQYIFSELVKRRDLTKAQAELQIPQHGLMVSYKM